MTQASRPMSCLDALDRQGVRDLLAFGPMGFQRIAAVIAVLVGASWLGARPLAQRPRFDFVISNGRIVDGTGAPWFRGDVGIVGDRITAIGALGEATTATKVDATNLVVAPGFIDLL